MKNEDMVWSVLARIPDGSTDDRVRHLATALRALPLADLEHFCLGYCDLAKRAFSAEMWCAVRIVWGSGSNDGFDYFVGWLIVQGKAAFESALANPDSIADLADVENSACEEVVGLAERVFRKRAGRDPQVPMQTGPRRLVRTWDFNDEDELRRRYPRLSARFAL